MKIEKLKYVERIIHGVRTEVIFLNDPIMFDRINELIEQHNDKLKNIYDEIFCDLKIKYGTKKNED